MKIMMRIKEAWAWLRSIKAQNVIATICILIVFTRFIYPALTFDAYSLYLFLIAMLCILVPDLAKLIARIRKIKIGDKEIDLGEEIDRVAEKAEKIEDEIASPNNQEFERSEQEPPPHIERYLRDPRGGLIAIAVDIEERVQKLVQMQNPIDSRRYISPMQGVEYLARQGLVSEELPMLMRDFWTVRNRAVHTSRIRVTEQDIYRLVDLGFRILELLTIRKKRG
jgi:hypothetical protein